MNDVSGLDIEEVDRLLLTAIHGADEEARAALKAWSRAVDIMSVSPAAFRLLPQLYLRATALDSSDAPLPQLRSTYRQFFYRNNLHVQQATTLLRKLSQISGDIIVTGDLPLVLRWYDDVGARPLDTLRLVVDQDVHAAICQCLGGELGLPSVNRLPQWARGLLGVRSFAGENGLRIDILRHFSTYGFSRKMDSEFRSRAIPFQIDDVQLRTTSSTDQLLLLLVESSLADSLAPLDWAADAATLIGNGSAEVLDVSVDAAKYRITVPVRERLAVLDTVLKSIVPQSWITRLGTAQASMHEEQEFLFRTGSARKSNPHRWHWHFYNLRFSDAMSFATYLRFAYEASSPWALPLTLAKRRMRQFMGS